MCALVFGCITPHPPVLVPEIGGERVAEVAATTRGMEELSRELAEARPQSILVVSPHGAYRHNAMGIMTRPSSKGNFDSWGVHGIPFSYGNDLDLVEAIVDEAERAGVPLEPIGMGGYDLDWGVTVPMYFLGRGAPGISVTPLTYSWLPLSLHLEFGRAIRKASERVDRRVAFVASGDLSHRLIPGAPAGFDPLGQVFDRKVVEALRAGNAEAILKLDPDLVSRAGECGYRSIAILLGALEGLQAQPEVLSYEGPFGVGYLVASFKAPNATSR